MANRREPRTRRQRRNGGTPGPGQVQTWKPTQAYTGDPWPQQDRAQQTSAGRRASPHATATTH
eukprot:1150887-Alexandrium_andersonii.AAC.1